MLGGSIGAALRYIVQTLVGNFRILNFPMGTFVVNIVGCFLMGLIVGCTQRWTSISGEWVLVLSVGFCGAFTTFSTFSADAMRLMDEGAWLGTLIYMGLSVLVGFSLFYLGKRLLFIG